MIASNQACSRVSRRWLLTGGSLALPLLIVLLGAAGGSDESELVKNRREIEQMTPAQRAQLDRNERLFQEMSPAEQQRYRDLHRQLQTAKDADALRLTLDRYRSWLKSLSPFDREELRQIDDLDQRVEFVRKLKAQQATPEPLSDETPRLSPQELTTVMQAIAAELKIDADDLNGKDEWQRQMFVLNQLLESSHGKRPPRDWAAVIDAELMEKILAALPPGDFRDAVASLRRFPGMDRQVVARNIVELLGDQMVKDLLALEPSSVELRAHSFHLRPEDRERYAELESPDAKEQFLLRRYRGMRFAEKVRPYPALRPIMFQWIIARHGDEVGDGMPMRRRGYEPGRAGSEDGRPFRPPGGPRGFRPGEKRQRPGERPKRPE